jgi:hypothetical protein
MNDARLLAGGRLDLVSRLLLRSSDDIAENQANLDGFKERGSLAAENHVSVHIIEAKINILCARS